VRQIITNARQVGEILKSRRKTRKVSQAALSQEIAVSQSRLSILETHPERLTLERLLVLAKVLGLELVLQDPAPRRGKVEW